MPFNGWQKLMIIRYFHALNQFQRTIFAAYIKRDYFAKQTHYEKKLMRSSQNVMRAMHHIRQIIPAEKISHFENAYELLYSLDLLKHRLSDHATFEICGIEFKQASGALSGLLGISFFAKRKREKAILFLQSAARSLENLFETTLQFIVADPLLVLFFVHSLKELSDESIFLCKEFL